ncbi:MAG: ATP-binding cassette domain-containing protein [Methylococcales bacterium]|nr:ATP-binding cassette domain-containing protein [Methylococcales bacterium]
MPLLQLSNVSIAYGTHALLDKANFQLDAGESVGLLGRNGEGKSTMMKIIAGNILADEGEIWRQPELKLAWLEQAPTLTDGMSIYDAVAEGLGDLGHWISRYHHLSMHMEATDEKALEELGNLQHQLETHNGWHFQQRVESTLSKLNLPADVKVDSLSGGWKRRVALAQALVIEPDVLLLDEPTNHLDFESIHWLEEQVSQFKGAVLFVTHDRSFLQKLATRIVDLDRGKLVSWQGNYQDYLRRKAAFLEEEANQNAEFDKKLALEETWIRQGVKARRTRNEGRVRALEQLRRERSERRNTQGTSKLTLGAADASGKKVIEVDNISFQYDEKIIIKNFSTLIQRGDKIGLIGANGSGKSTFLKLLLQQLTPTEGEISQGTKLEIAYFDQLREQLDPEITVADSVAQGSDFIEIGGNKRHVMSYLSDFLFSPARARSPVKSLSGGEKNRLLLAKLFTRPANLIVMDEPTNDLDLETLELLEAKLVNFNGTVLLVSHDRAFLDNVVTSVLIFDGTGHINEFIGGYSDWSLHHQQQRKAQQAQEKTKSNLKKSKANTDNPKKITYKQQQTLDALPEKIDQLEQSQQALNEKINAPTFYQQSKQITRQVLHELQETEQKLEQAYQLWDKLDALSL